MTEELKELVKSKVLQFIAGTQPETNKFEVKRQWYKLKDKQDKYEFLKDIVAIVNSWGGEDAFIVFGIDEKNTDKIFATYVTDSGCSDSSQIKDIVDSGIDLPIRFDIDSIEVNGKVLSVLHLVPSTQKPHYVLKYKNEKGQVFKNVPFIRSGSAKVEASRSDIERMYIERKSILVERRLEVSINLSDLLVKKSENRGYLLKHPFTIENTGSRVAAIAQVELELLYGANGVNDLSIKFFTTGLSHKTLIIESGKLYSGKLIFETSFNDDHYYETVVQSYQGVNARIGSCRIRLSSGEIVTPQLHIHSTPGEFPIDFVGMLH